MLEGEQFKEMWSCQSECPFCLFFFFPHQVLDISAEGAALFPTSMLTYIKNFCISLGHKGLQ